MDFSLKTVFFFVFFIFTWLYQEQNNQWELTLTNLKNSNNLAVHDAILFPDPHALSEGKLIIDKNEALDRFKETLQLNLGLNETMDPKPGSPMRAPVEIVEFIIFDDTNSTFPFLYENPTYHVSKYLHGPAAFAVIKTDYPKIINRFGTGSDILVPAIEEFKLNQLYP